jgi:hypothetical protein
MPSMVAHARMRHFHEGTLKGKIESKKKEIYTGQKERKKCIPVRKKERNIYR